MQAHEARNKLTAYLWHHALCDSAGLNEANSAVLDLLLVGKLERGPKMVLIDGTTFAVITLAGSKTTGWHKSLGNRQNALSAEYCVARTADWETWEPVIPVGQGIKAEK